MAISGECEAWIHKQRQIFFSRATWWKKMSGLVLTETDRTLWVMFDQEQFSLNSVHRKIKVVKRDGR